MMLLRTQMYKHAVSFLLALLWGTYLKCACWIRGHSLFHFFEEEPFDLLRGSTISHSQQGWSGVYLSLTLSPTSISALAFVSLNRPPIISLGFDLHSVMIYSASLFVIAHWFIISFGERFIKLLAHGLIEVFVCCCWVVGVYIAHS